MDIALHTAYALLGIHPAATRTEVRRAFRRQVVVWHRTRAIAMAEHIEDLKRAYALVQANGSNVLPRHAALPPQASPPPGWSLPTGSRSAGCGDDSRYRTEGRLRTQAAAEFSSCAARQGAEAVAANEAKIEALLRETGRPEQPINGAGRARSWWLGLRK